MKDFENLSLEEIKNLLDSGIEEARSNLKFRNCSKCKNSLCSKKTHAYLKREIDEVDFSVSEAYFCESCWGEISEYLIKDLKRNKKIKAFKFCEEWVESFAYLSSPTISYRSLKEIFPGIFDREKCKIEVVEFKIGDDCDEEVFSRHFVMTFCSQCERYKNIFYKNSDDILIDDKNNDYEVTKELVGQDKLCSCYSQEQSDEEEKKQREVIVNILTNKQENQFYPESSNHKRFWEIGTIAIIIFVCIFIFLKYYKRSRNVVEKYRRQ